MKKAGEILNSFLVGIGIGNIIAIVVGLLIGVYFPVVPEFAAKQSSLLDAVIKANIAYGILGTVGYISGKVFKSLNENPGRNLFKLTFLNLIINVTVFSIVGIYLKWFKPEYLILPIAMFCVIYFVIWTFKYYMHKKEIASINEKLGK